jgi:hypothetical protein
MGRKDRVAHGEISIGEDEGVGEETEDEATDVYMTLIPKVPSDCVREPNSDRVILHALQYGRRGERGTDDSHDRDARPTDSGRQPAIGERANHRNIIRKTHNEKKYFEIA